MLFTGLLINKDILGKSLQWLLTTSFFHAAYEALAVNELKYLQLKETKVSDSVRMRERDVDKYALVRCRARCTRRYNLVHVRIQGTSVLVAGYWIFGNLHRDFHHCQLLGATLLGHREAVKEATVQRPCRLLRLFLRSLPLQLLYISHLCLLFFSSYTLSLSLYGSNSPYNPLSNWCGAGTYQRCQWRNIEGQR